MNLTNMGEQPIYTTKAHIFQIDPETKRKWLPASSQAINVSYYYDNSRHTYRIISVEGTKAVINSTITPKMMIAKTSQKFGQWSDPRANTVYGLGFATEVELTKFIEKFEEIKELSREKQKSQILETNSVVGDVSSVSSSEGSENIAKLNKNTHNQKSASLGNVNDVGNCTAKESSVELRKSNSTNSAEGQLKYENDRLKLALAQSSSNAKKWEVELQTLKNNNVRLTTALQESNANVEEWKTQLASYKDECARLRRKVADIEQGQANAEHVHNQKMESTIGELAEKLRSVKIETKDKDSEINRLRNKLDELLPYESHNKKLLDRVAALEKDKEALKTNISKTQVDLESCRVEKTKERQKLLHLQRQVGLKLSELSAIHDEVTSNLQSQ